MHSIYVLHIKMKALKNVEQYALRVIFEVAAKNGFLFKTMAVVEPFPDIVNDTFFMMQVLWVCASE